MIQDPAGPRILVVDDNEDNRYMLTLYLDIEGYSNVVVACEGEEAIARLGRNSFDLVLLDVMMPKVDGYQVLAWLQGRPDLHDVPVIMISALDEMSSVIRCIELGALDYLMKPFNPVLLKARLAATLEKKRLRDELGTHLARLKEEVEAARRLQMAMVPGSFPAPTAELPLDVFATMEPAREVGGDLYDFFTAPDKRFAFLIGDVSGKGIAAALFMARAKALIRITTELMPRPEGVPVTPADIVARVNRELCLDNSDMMFVTLFFGLLSPQTGELEFCNAGHNAPYRLSGQCLQPVDAVPNVPLGIRPAARYDTGRFALVSGETLFLFTDGVTDASNAGQDAFSEARLESALRAAADCTSLRIIDAVSTALHDFVGDALPADDITMLALRRVPACRLSDV